MSSRKIKAIQQLVIKPGELDSIFNSLSMIMSSQDKNPLRDLFQDIGENIIIPILMLPPDQIPENFDKWLPSFQYKLKAIIDILKDSNILRPNSK
jgi:hypothetical protein